MTPEITGNHTQIKNAIVRTSYTNYVSAGFLVFLLGLFLSLSCQSMQDLKDPKNYSSITLPAYSIHLIYPGNWALSFSQERFYNLIISGIAPNGMPGTIEFRSLANRLPDRSLSTRAIYVAGWYKAHPTNYRGWKYLDRGQVKTDSEGTWTFEATFQKGDTVFFRMGRLRFRGKRIHAIYYTTTEDRVDLMREYFSYVDSLHSYNVKDSADALEPTG